MARTQQHLSKTVNGARIAKRRRPAKGAKRKRQGGREVPMHRRLARMIVKLLDKNPLDPELGPHASRNFSPVKAGEWTIRLCEPPAPHVEFWAWEAVHANGGFWRVFVRFSDYWPDRSAAAEAVASKDGALPPAAELLEAALVQALKELPARRAAVGKILRERIKALRTSLRRDDADVAAARARLKKRVGLLRSKLRPGDESSSASRPRRRRHSIFSALRALADSDHELAVLALGGWPRPEAVAKRIAKTCHFMDLEIMLERWWREQLHIDDIDPKVSRRPRTPPSSLRSSRPSRSGATQQALERAVGPLV